MPKARLHGWLSIFTHMPLSDRRARFNERVTSQNCPQSLVSNKYDFAYSKY
jgi:hypothetical protein